MILYILLPYRPMKYFNLSTHISYSFFCGRYLRAPCKLSINSRPCDSSVDHCVRWKKQFYYRFSFYKHQYDHSSIISSKCTAPSLASLAELYLIFFAHARHSTLIILFPGKKSYAITFCSERNLLYNEASLDLRRRSNGRVLNFYS